MIRSHVCTNVSAFTAATLTVLASNALVLGAPASRALAQSTATPPAQATFDSLDKNRDGQVSLNEAAENDRLFVAFKELDRNRDGMLTREEFAAFENDKSSS
jgi:hypothetical protein